jgi:Holliday junction resolvase
MPQYCNFAKCKKYASYNFPNEKSRLWCKEHSQPGMIIVKQDSRICQHSNHTEKPPRASFNFSEQKRPIYCKAHALEGMINLNSKNSKCVACRSKQPSYGNPGSKATHCSKCSLPGMVDLVSRLCSYPGCRKNCVYGIPGQKATRCRNHAEIFMIDVKNKKCEICISLKVKKPKQPAFGIEKPTHCLEHKKDMMIDLRHNTERCEMCTKRPTYGFEGQKPRRCKNHKEEKMVDVVSVMCSSCGKIQGVFGVQKGQLFCVNCKTEEMKNIKAKMCKGCREKQPTYNYKGKKVPLYCAGCSLDGMIDIKNPRCKSCQLFMVKSKSSLCSYCSPTSPQRQKTREMVVVNYLEENGIEFIHNTSVGYVCGNYRPDIKIDAGTHFVMIEIDEDQHRQYDKSCEIARMLNIHQAEGLRCVFLRYNPDVFRSKNGAQKVHQTTRLKKLLEETVKHKQNIPEDEITVYRLFYNNDSGNHVEKYDIGFACMKLISELQEGTLLQT